MRQFKVQFVCAGNICRSPLAHAVFQREVCDSGEEGRIVVNSSGTGGWHVGERADPRARDVAQRHGVEITHRARQFSLQDLQEYDLILAMDAANQADIRHLGAGSPYLEKVRLFREFDPEATDSDREVPDPYYGGPGGFEKVYQMVKRTTEPLLQEVQRRLSHLQM